MHKLDVDKMIERNRNGEYDRHTFNPEKETATHKGGESHGRDTSKSK